MGSRARAGRRPKVSCDECFFRCNGLCALDLTEPCPTFRPAGPGLIPPTQLTLVERPEPLERRGGLLDLCATATA